MSAGGAQGPRATVLFHEAEIQGAGVAVERVLPGLAERGWALEAWFPYDGPLVARIDALVGRTRGAPSPFAFSVAGWRRPPGPGRRLRRLPGYLRATRRALEAGAPDVVVANTLLSLPEATVAHRLGLPVVLYVHELPPAGRKRDVTLRWVAAVADVVVAVSGAVEEMLRPYVPAERLVRIVSGVPVERFGRIRRTPDERFVVGALGGLNHRKGADVLLDAAGLLVAELDDVDVLHVGPPPWDGDGDFGAKVDARMATLPADRVRLAGIRPATEALAGMDVLVMASRIEPFGLACLEAMAAGLPVIASAVGGLVEQIEHEVSGILVAPEDPAAIAHWVRRLHDEPELRSRLGANARARAQGFSIDRQCDRLDAALRRAIAARA